MLENIEKERDLITNTTDIAIETKNDILKQLKNFKNSGYDDKINEIKQSLSQVIDIVDKLDEKIDKLNQNEMKIREKQNVNIDITTNISTRLDDIETVNKELRDLMVEKNRKEDKLKEYLENEVVNSDKRIVDDLKNELKLIKNEIKSRNDEIEQLKDDFKTYNDNYSNISENISKNIQKYISNSEKLNIDNFRAEIQQNESQINNNNSNIIELQKTINEKDVEINNLIQKNKILNEKILEITKNVNSYDSLLGSVKNAEELITNRKELERKLDKLKDSISGNDIFIGKLFQKLDRLEMNSNELRRSKRWNETRKEDKYEAIMKDITEIINKYDLSIIDLEKGKKEFDEINEKLKTYQDSFNELLREANFEQNKNFNKDDVNKLKDYIFHGKEIRQKLTNLEDEKDEMENLLNKLNRKLGFMVTLLDGDTSYDELDTTNPEDYEDEQIGGENELYIEDLNLEQLKEHNISNQE